MKKKLQLTTIQVVFTFFCFCCLHTTLFSQQATSEWRSAASGDFNNAGGTIWEKNVLGTWTLQAAATKPSGSSNVTIRAGHTVTLSATTSILGLTIEAGAKLNSTAAITAPITFRVGTSSSADITSGFTSNIVVIQNDGVLGSLADADAGINLEVEKNCKTLTLQGTGTCRIGRTRFLYPNLNVPATFNINQSMHLGLAGSGSFTAYYNNAANIASENNVINLAAGKTVTLATGGSFHGGVSSTAPTANPQGTMTYNIFGTLDLSATASGGLQTSTNATGAASLNLNIKSGGVMKLGTAFAAYKGGSNGSINMVIESGGIVDGTLLTGGVTNNSSTLNTGYTWFVTQGTGTLKLPVSATSQTFPIGASSTSYNPVTMNNGGGTVYSANVVASNAPAGLPNTAKALNRTWTVSPASTADLNFGYNAGEGNASCVLTDGMTLYNSSGGAWTALGTATPSVPTSGATGYQVSYSAVAFGGTIFNLANTATIPVELMTFSGYAKGDANQLAWTTASERNNAAFNVERSSNGLDFQTIGSVKGSGTSAKVMRYTFTDETPLSICYYRLRQIDFDGKETVSHTVTINQNDKNKQGILKTYPSVTSGILNIDYAATSDVMFSVRDVLGKTMLSQRVKNNNGFNTTQLDVSALASGMYLLSFESATLTKVQKFEKQ